MKYSRSTWHFLFTSE